MKTEGGILLKSLQMSQSQYEYVLTLKNYLNFL